VCEKFGNFFKDQDPDPDELKSWIQIRTKIVLIGNTVKSHETLHLMQNFTSFAGFKVSLCRGLIHPWKQIVYYNFDTTMNQSLLMSIVRLCELSHASVRGIICDMGNSKLLKELKIYSECKHFFENPCDASRKIYIFPDIPHCIKNLRNHCLDYGLCIKAPDNKTLYLTKQHFQDLISADEKDFKLCPKLSLIHVNCKGNDRQRVKYAVQLFSDTVAKALKFKFGDTLLAQSEIVTIIDSWFDVMNSHCKFHWKKNKCALGVHQSEQLNALGKMLDLVKNMYFGNDNTGLTKKPFQTGIIVSINATIDLYNELKHEGLSYLITSRLNQDSLENLFSQIRALGGNNHHPTSVDAINRLRKICLTKNAQTIVSSSSPVEGGENDEDVFLSVSIVDEINDQCCQVLPKTLLK
jgi:hypothetical protein